MSDQNRLGSKPNYVNSATTEMVLDAEQKPDILNELDFKTWLPFAAKTYDISPNIEDYILVVTIICPSDIPNRNAIGFPISELTKFQPPPISRMAYKAWVGTPVHLEHDNEVHKKAYGVVLDAALHKVEGYGEGKLWKVMGLLAIDKKKYPAIAEKVRTGEINTYSMGAYVDYFTCSYCDAKIVSDVLDDNGNVVKRGYGCPHVDHRQQVSWGEYRDYEGNRHLAFRNAHGIAPFEVSIAADPAWVAALSDTLLTNPA